MTAPTEDPVNQGLTSVDTHSAQDLDRISKLPKEIGVLLVIVGIGGILLPVGWCCGQVFSDESIRHFTRVFQKYMAKECDKCVDTCLIWKKGTLPSHPKKEKPLRILLVNRRKSIIITAALDSITNSNESLKIQRLFTCMPIFMV